MSPSRHQNPASFDSLATGGTTQMKRESAADGSESILNETPAFTCTSRISVPSQAPDVVLIETSFLPKWRFGGRTRAPN